MITEQTKIITDYVSVWSWLIISWITLSCGITLLVLDRTAFALGILGAFGILFIITILKKWKLEESIKGGNENAESNS